MNTRFNPTVNGYLHLGHLYNCLINQAEARRTGGVFGVRLDDNQRYWNWKHGPKAVQEYAAQMREDLAFFGIEPAYWYSQDERSAEVSELMRLEFGYHPEPQSFAPNHGAAEVIGMPGPWYPLVEEITAEKVAFDFMDGVTWCIRGIDLLPEDCLYRYFCEMFQIPQPRLTYIPRLQFEGDEVSKTAGKFKLKDFRAAGIDPTEVIERLAGNCLTGGGWTVHNLKPDPALGEWEKEMLYGVHS